ncbi:MAG: mannose-1-phosphate guanylyltransferase [Candidatus Abyssobacteria bacterium SURF_17]|uniref:mannose-1-phosphate guanylyltransferase n=1 Tax=Candidatus Abyssobacteria bacterium SURF_17 TaxID=2093361 RepID=A0A419F188_9BACT|nr:MAG: mannose-1-phosphate guanylyltransferase [Candidatus Abyssubacteria bacterium SURF_17]
MYAVIMAGGSGTRLWPKSRKKKPKQLLDIVSSKTMIQETVERLSPLIDGNHTFIVVGRMHFEYINEQLVHVPTENILVEPEGKNTAPCIGLAAIHIRARDKDAVMVVLPSDHLIRNDARFRKTLRASTEVAQSGNHLVTIGIQPTFPETGYGYIQIGKKVDTVHGEDVFKVVAFKEKPSLAVAKKFLKSGNYMWNSGMFVWKATAILEQIKIHLPDLYRGLLQIETAIGEDDENKVVDEVYASLKPESIDFGVMERAEDVLFLKGDFGWNDIGSWAAMEQIWPKDRDGNFLHAEVVSIESTGNIIHSTKKLVAVIGLKDIVIIETDDALLVCPKERAPDVRRVVDELKKRGLDSYL